MLLTDKEIFHQLISLFGVVVLGRLKDKILQSYFLSSLSLHRESQNLKYDILALGRVESCIPVLNRPNP